MLMIIDSLPKLDFRQLMDVYEESNSITGKETYPDLPENLQLIYAEQDSYVYLEEFFKEPTARYAVWIYEGYYTAALRFERYSDGLLLTALETSQAFRRKGFATKLIDSVIEHMRCNGNGILYSHVNKNNAPSLKVHQSCGFSVISNQAVFLDGTVKTDYFTLSVNY